MKNLLSQQNYLVCILVWIHVDLHFLIYILKYFYRLEELIQESQQRAIEQADVDSLGTSLGELDDSSRMSMPSSETPTMPKGNFWDCEKKNYEILYLKAIYVLNSFNFSWLNKRKKKYYKKPKNLKKISIWQLLRKSQKSKIFKKILTFLRNVNFTQKYSLRFKTFCIINVFHFSIYFPGKSKKKKGRPNRKAKMNKSYNNLMDDLQYSSDEDRFDGNIFGIYLPQIFYSFFWNKELIFIKI